ncbi:ankyrin repeat-containing domain protein, partial [Paraphoma chrysanthemicola]
EGHAIRLLRLVRGTGPIQAYLFKAFIHKTGNGMPFEALSYTWGTNERTKQIILNGERFMLTENLYSALQSLRFEDKDRILWIDAICIDQSHIAERNHQVSHMASIYRDADRVLFWLGNPTYETKRLISSLRQLQARASDTPTITPENAHDSRWKTLWDDEGCNDDFELLRSGLVLLLNQPWFQRSWILQEVCFAETGVVTCGTETIAAHMFALAPWLLNHNPEAHCKAVLQMMPGATRSTRTFLSGREMRNFYSLLRRFHRSEATDPRDQVYALLSMASDANMAGFPGVDYGKEFKEIVNSIFTYLFPTSWDQCRRSHSYQSLSKFVEDFPRLKEAEIQAANDDILLKLRLSDDTELNQLHPQGAFRIAIQTGDAQLLQNLLRFPNINLNENYSYKVERAYTHSLSPLCAAAACGYTDVVNLLTRHVRPDDINSIYSRTPLLWAAENGHQTVAKLLLDKGADVNAQNGHSNALQAASEGGHEQVVKLLLNKGANVNAQGGKYSAQGGKYKSSALQAASEGGHEQVVKLLLDKGADVNAQCGVYNRSALQAASERGHEQVVKLLLDKGADVNAQCGVYNRSALQAASERGHEQVVKLLLDKGADVNAQGGVYNRSALQAASEGGHEQVVKLLLDKGADVNAHGGLYGSALHAASQGGHEHVVRLLLNKGADVNAESRVYGSALHAASEGGHEHVVKLLLNKGADVNAHGGEYGSALGEASEGGHEQVVKLLLDKGADVNAQSGWHSNALQAASQGGNEQVVKLLLDKGADVNAQSGWHSNALQAASQGGHEQVVKLLVAKGASVQAPNVKAQGHWFSNALQAASKGGYKRVVKLLLNKGANGKA